MKSIMKYILVVSIVVIGLCLSSGSVVADTVVSNVVITPTEPERFDTITITATITSDEEIETVELVIKECRGTPEESGLCYTPETFEMDPAGDDSYTVDYTLHYSDTGYFGYHFDVNGVSTSEADTNVVLKVDAGNGGGDDDGDDDNGSPGFELITLLAAVAIGVILLKRKRSR